MHKRDTRDKENTQTKQRKKIERVKRKKEKGKEINKTKTIAWTIVHHFCFQRPSKVQINREV